MEIVLLVLQKILWYSFFITLEFIFTNIVVKVERFIENTFSIIFL